MTSIPPHIIFFDGVCNLCNGAVNFVIKHDTENLFHFSSLQSDYAKEVLGDNYPRGDHFDTIIYSEQSRLYYRSEAVLRIAKKLGFPFSMVYGVIVLPGSLRDLIYRFISRNRYKWFGKKDQCMIPKPEVKSRFL